MIDESNPGLQCSGAEDNRCFECASKLKKGSEFYAIFKFSLSAVEYFPNDKAKMILFCLPCWNLIAGKRYTFMSNI